MPEASTEQADRFQTMRRLFQAALERPPNERADFLRDACGDDLSLRSEVDRLLSSDEGRRA